jgi:hypothetical protein
LHRADPGAKQHNLSFDVRAAAGVAASFAENTMHSFKPHAATLVATFGFAPLVATASCGSAFCTINTDWNVQGVFTEPGGRVELRYENLRQDSLRAGSQKVSPADVPSHHDELYTKNQALFGTIDYNFGSGWGMSLIVPLVQRDHAHIHNHQGEALYDAWDFSGLGDVRVGGRKQWQLALGDTSMPQSAGLLAGLKLPTGRSNVANDEGEVAERSLQPGTGTTDAFGGAFYQVSWLPLGLSAFAQGVYGAALNTYQGFKPGSRFAVDAGLRYEAASGWALLLQLNALWRGRDSGAQAEPDDSGGRTLFLSPGLSWSIGREMQIFAIAQLPLYQYVNGVQLTANWGATAGVGWRF